MKHGSIGKPEFLLGHHDVFGISANVVTLFRGWLWSQPECGLGYCGGRKLKV